ncbi:hypothetical protein, partial [Clavibacter michiganensis]|uniref:hypothetical protein n=1 Tax=Clavibacter michiganensis TaxID=28447 RepID=UPI001F4E41AB
AAAQHAAAGGRPDGRALTGADVIRGIATGYEIQVDLVKAISLRSASPPTWARAASPTSDPRPIGRRSSSSACRRT